MRSGIETIYHSTNFVAVLCSIIDTTIENVDVIIETKVLRIIDEIQILSYCIIIYVYKCNEIP